MSERFNIRLLRDEETFDRLADGELSDAEERALLSGLDAQPDGWRRCALALLEAHAWNKELMAIADGHAPHMNGTQMQLSGMSFCAIGSANAATAKINDRPGQPHPWIGHLAVAACVALAFFLGMAARGYWSVDGVNVRGVVAETSQGALAQSDQQQTSGLGTLQAVASSLSMALFDSQGDAQERFEVPLVEANQLDPNWLATPPAAMPPDEVEALRREGYRVDQQRWLVPVVLDDGRQAIVPVDQANVRYAGVQF
jgi:hypothetical protein